MTKIISTRNVQTLCNTEPKSWLQSSGPGSRKLLLGLQSWIIDIGFYVLVPGFLAPGPQFWVKGFEFWVPVHSVVITKCGMYCKVRPKSITKYGRYSKV